jgi:hypothetical protein
MNSMAKAQSNNLDTSQTAAEINEQDQDKNSKKESFVDRRSDFHAWSVAVLFLVMRTLMMWHKKSLNFVYGYSWEGSSDLANKYEITTSYPMMDQYYGVLAGLAYSLPQSLCGLGLGFFDGKITQKALLVSLLGLAGVT